MKIRFLFLVSFLLLTSFHLTDMAGNQELVEYLLARGPDPNRQDAEGLSPLICAAWQGYIHIVKFLLSKGAQPAIATRDGQTALTVARDKGYNQIVELLTPKI